MKITLIRHAESTYNEKKIFQGQANCGLSKKGFVDTIEKAKNFLQDFDVCFCSPLDRTRVTAETLVPYLDIIYDDRLKERSLGDFENLLITDERKAYLQTHIPPNGETFYELDLRVISFLDTLKNEYSGKNVLVVTHGGIIYTLYRVLGLEVDYVDNLQMLTIEI